MIDDGVKLRTYCVTHEKPLVPDALADYVVGIGDYRPTRGAHVSILDPFWDQMRPYSYGAAGNYVIPRAIERAGTTHLTGIFSHRKIIVRTQIGRQSPVLGFYFEITPEEAVRLPREEIHPRTGYDFLIGFPFMLEQGVVAHYIQEHHGADLFDYISMAVDSRILTHDEADGFAKEKYFVPGGCELGIYPTSWVRPVLQKLEKLGREFVTRRGARILKYNNYQVRAVGFLAERLGSYWLLTELRNRFPKGFPRDMFGYLCAIVPSGGAYDGATV